MAKGLLGRKVGMTSVFDEAGNCVAVTVIEAGPCPVLLHRTASRDGYDAIQLGFAAMPRRLASRSIRGHVAPLDSSRRKRRQLAGATLPPKANCEPQRFVREFRGWESPPDVGATVNVTELAEVKAVDVTGISKGRGYAGVMKRHHFGGQRASHGVKKVHRHLGSAGCSAFPSRTFKGKRMPGQYGNAKRTARNLTVYRIVPEQNLLLVRGAVPGANGGFVVIRATNMM